MHKPHHQFVQGRHRRAYDEGVAARAPAGDGFVDQLQPRRAECQLAGGVRVGGDQSVIEFAALGAQLVHRAGKDDPAGADDGHLGTQRLKIIHAMAGKHHGCPVGGKAGKDAVYVVLAGRVQTVGRLVQDQQPRHGQQRGGESQPLAHAKREAPDPVVGDVGESDLMQHLVDAGRSGVAAAKRRECGKVLPSGERGVQPRAVHEASDTVRRRPRAPDRRAQHFQAAAVGDRQAQQKAKQRGFPGAVRADQTVDPAARHIQVDAVECDDITEAFGNPPRPHCQGHVHEFVLLHRRHRSMKLGPSASNLAEMRLNNALNVLDIPNLPLPPLGTGNVGTCALLG